MHVRALVVYLVALLAVRTIADACRCKDLTLDEHLNVASTVVTGTIIQTMTQPECGRRPDSCKTAYTYVIAVDTVYKGSAPEVIVARAGTARGDCTHGSLGKNVEKTRWLFMFGEPHPPFSIRLCNDPQRATPEVLEVVMKKLGAGNRPSP